MTAFANFTSSLGFIIFFLVMVVILDTVFNEQIATGFLWLVLIGMVLTNTDKIAALAAKYSGGGK